MWYHCGSCERGLIVELVLMHGDTRYVIVVDVIQTLMYFDDWSSVSVRRDV
jgi:hypothetical protein